MKIPLFIGAGALLTTGAICNNAEAPQQALREKLHANNVTKFYNDNCSNCHGVNGEGGGAGTKSLNTLEKFDQKYDKPFFDAIKKGVLDSGMAAFGETTDDATIWSMVVHIRELQARALREEKPNRTKVGGTYTAGGETYRIEDVVTSGLKTPWATEWLPNGKMLVTNRPGSMVVVENGVVTATVEGLPETIEMGQGGLMDIAIHPDYAKNGWIYMSFTDPGKDQGRRGFTKIVRGKLSISGSTAKWSSQQTIFEAEQSNYSGSGIHFGNRIIFDGKGHIFWSFGERGSGNLAQDLTRPHGKIMRTNEDGSIPADNPFVDVASKEKGYLPQIWSYGHRNPQGLVLTKAGVLWDTEHAPRGGDELNTIVKGGNYGWPIVSFCINYNDSPYATPWPTEDQKIVMPKYRWLPSTAECGMDEVAGNAFPRWKGHLVTGGLAGNKVDLMMVKGPAFVSRIELVFGLGRVRDVKCGPDGYIYITLNQPDKVVRLVPAR